MADGITAPRTAAPPPTTGGKVSASSWISQHKVAVIGTALGAGALIYLYVRNKNSTAAAQAANAAAAGGSPSASYPYSTGITGDTNFGDYYAGILNQINSSNQALSTGLTGLQTSILSAINANAANNQTGATTPTTPATGGAGAQPGYGVVQTAQGPMVWLGNIGHYGYSVGAGAPVYFGNAQSLSQGLGQYTGANDIYTPVAYSQFVGNQPTEFYGQGSPFA